MSEQAHMSAADFRASQKPGKPRTNTSSSTSARALYDYLKAHFPARLDTWGGKRLRKLFENDDA